MTSVNLETLAVVAVLAGAVVYLAYLYIPRAGKKAGCACSCGGCGNARSCTEAAMNLEKGIPLRQLQMGCKARILSIRADGELGRRIRDMGLVPGELVELTGRAPLRDPVSLRLRDFTLSLRNNEADQITVTPC